MAEDYANVDGRALPRDVTLLRVASHKGESPSDCGGHNASWEVDVGARRTITDNPLLKRVMTKPAVALADPSYPPTLDCKPKKYSLGDSVLPKDLPRETNESKRNRAVMVSKLKVGDTLLVRRSNGSYSYSEVQKKSRTTITFTVSAAGDTKVIDLRSAPKHVRLLHEGAGPQMGVKVTSRSACLQRCDSAPASVFSPDARGPVSTPSLRALRQKAGHGSDIHGAMYC